MKTTPLAHQWWSPDLFLALGQTNVSHSVERGELCLCLTSMHLWQEEAHHTDFLWIVMISGFRSNSPHLWISPPCECKDLPPRRPIAPPAGGTWLYKRKGVFLNYRFILWWCRSWSNTLWNDVFPVEFNKKGFTSEFHISNQHLVTIMCFQRRSWHICSPS